MKNLDVLNLEWSSQGRDRETVIPIKYYCEKQGGLSFKCFPIWNFYAIDKLRPKLVFMTNTVGAGINYSVLKYCVKRNISVISLTAEGNFFPEDIHIQTWGWNKDKIKYEKAWFVWSKKAARMVIGSYPEIKSKIYISGAIGYDRYRIYKFMDKNKFSLKYKHSYKKIVGYAGWIFGSLERFKNEWSEKRIQLAQIDKLLVNDILRKIIIDNSDVLFVLKQHPADINIDRSELKNLNQFPNTIIIKSEESIGDIINVCDIWLAYDSNTAAEAWCLDPKKPTIFINPTTTKFKRHNLYKGVLIANAFEELQGILNSFYNNGYIDSFDIKCKDRQRILEDLVGWYDGLNHVRVGKFIVEFIRKRQYTNYQKRIDKDYLSNLFQHICIKLSKMNLNLPYIRNYNYIHEYFDIYELDKLERKYYKMLDTFYANNAVNIKNTKPATKYSCI